MKYYLISGNRIVADIDRAPSDITALALMREDQAMSLINEKHVVALLGWIRNHGYPGATAIDVIDALGLVDDRPE